MLKIGKDMLRIGKDRLYVSMLRIGKDRSKIMLSIGKDRLKLCICCRLCLHLLSIVYASALDCVCSRTEAMGPLPNQSLTPYFGLDGRT